LPGGGEVGAFLKRQENHITKTITHPINGISTFQREFKNIQQFISMGLPTLEPIYFARRNHQGNLQAILMTRELEAYQSLETERFFSGGEVMVDKAERVAILTSLAKVMRNMHSHHLQHNCLYPKHIFVKQENNDWDIRLIDLEKLKWRLFKRSVTLRDIGTLYRNESRYDLSLSEQMLFMKTYMNEQKLSAATKEIWRAVRKASFAKNRRQHK
jgi:hypothetical protein